MRKDYRDRKLELLSPAGNLEIFKAVVNAGADAVYFGGNAFGARAYAKNFSPAEGAEAIRYAHLHGKKAYLTVNTLLKNTEIERQLYDFIRGYYEAGLDAVIVQDFGVFAFLRDFFPELPIHASTQMSVCTPEGTRFLVKAGASRIVIARELSLEELAAIYDACGCEIEAFIHGALCVCYSGQCLMSSLLGGRSGNRGRCAQPCRLPYQVLDEKGDPVKLPGPYVLSPKDLCTIASIPQMAKAGVYSLKIEGRMKQLSYAAGVVSVYRRYVDRYLEYGAEGYRVSEEDQKLLFDLGNRSGFTDGYLRRQNGREMITFTEGTHRKEEGLPAPAEKKIPLRGVLTARKGEPLSLAASCGEHQVTVRHEGTVEAAKKQPADREMIAEKLRQTGGTPFLFTDLSIDMDADAFLPMAWLKELRRSALEELTEELTAVERAAANPYAPLEVARPVSPEGLRRKSPGHLGCIATVETREQFLACVAEPVADKVAVAAELLQDEDGSDAVSFYQKEAQAHRKELFLLLPPVIRQRTAGELRKILSVFDTRESGGVIACSYDALGLLEELGIPEERILLDQRLYTMNNRSADAFRQLGYAMMTAPFELKEGELSHRENRDSCLSVYGRAVLMVTANCLAKNAAGCQKREKLYWLQDRYQARFPVKNHCRYCYNTIYNAKILCLFPEAEKIMAMDFAAARLDFTLESGEETRRVLRFWEEAVSPTGKAEGKNLRIPEQELTKGHWRRGVE